MHPEKPDTAAGLPRTLHSRKPKSRKGIFTMTKQMFIPNLDSTPLPLIVATNWNFKLNYHDVDGDLFYAIEDWIAGITESNPRKAQIAWRDIQKRDVSLKLTSLPHTGQDGKIYQKPHTNDQGLYLIAQSLRVTKDRQALREIKDYLAKAGVFVDNLRTNKEGARDKLRGELNLEKPDEAIEEAIAGYRRQRRSQSWIDARLKGIGNRLIFSDTMADTCNTRPDFAGATNAGYKEMFDMIKAEIVKYLGLNTAQARRLRDHLSKLALQGISLYEIAAAQKMEEFSRILTREEQVQIVKDCAAMVAPSIRNLSAYLGIDLVSGKRLIAG